MKFIDSSFNIELKNSFIGIIPVKITSKKELLNKLYKKLRFPDYFGFNWDALSDCLKDFSWISEKNIYLIHSDLPSLGDTDTKIYLEVLEKAVQDWKNGDEHSLIVTFPKEIEEAVRKYIE